MANAKYYGTGRRKKSVARVYLVPGTGKITINKRDIDDYLGLETLKVVVRQPLVATNTTDKFDVIVNVHGGGYTGQAGAIRHGIARALLEADADYRPVLKSAGFLTRDPRMKPDRSRSFPLSLSRLLARLSRLALAGSTAAAAGANASRRGGRPSVVPSLTRSLARRPRRRGAPDPRGGPADLPPAGKERGPLRSCFRRHAPGPPRGSRTRARAARPAGADPPSGTGGEADGETKPRRRRRTC